jgi:hypothetical protein
MRRRHLVIDHHSKTNYHFGKPPFYKILIQDEGDSIRFYFDFDEERLLGFWYEGIDSSLVTSYSSISQYAEGLALNDLLSIDIGALFRSSAISPNENFLLFIKLLFRQALYRYQGVVETPYLLAKACSHELLCRCQGVYRHQIIEFLLANPSSTITALRRESKASLTCTTCSDDLEGLFQKTKDQFGLQEESKKTKRFSSDYTYSRPTGLTPAKFLLLVNEERMTWQAREQIPPQIDFEIIDIDGYQIRILVTGTERQQDYVDALESYLKNRLASGIKILLAV